MKHLKEDTSGLVLHKIFSFLATGVPGIEDDFCNVKNDHPTSNYYNNNDIKPRAQ